jgi:SnoaL-like domain
VSPDELSARLRAVEDRLALIELEGAYARAFDSHDGVAWAALFTDDGVYQSRDATPGNGTYVAGRAKLAKFCTNAPFSGIHYLHLPQLSIDGDVATGRVHLEFVAAFNDDGAPMTRFLGYYDVRYVRAGDGWLIERRITTTFARRTDTTFGYAGGSGLDDT